MQNKHDRYIAYFLTVLASLTCVFVVLSGLYPPITVRVAMAALGLLVLVWLPPSQRAAAVAFAKIRPSHAVQRAIAAFFGWKIDNTDKQTDSCNGENGSPPKEIENGPRNAQD